jgi:hypothetical protein
MEPEPQNVGAVLAHKTDATPVLAPATTPYPLARILKKSKIDNKFLIFQYTVQAKG